MKIKKILLIILAIIIILPFIGRLIWEFSKGQKVNILLVNKTVSANSKNQGKSINWVLNYNKYLKSNDKSYNYHKDYYGYHPHSNIPDLYIKSYKLDDIQTLRDEHNLLYFIDNEGVNTQGQLPDGPEYYGGLNQNDYLLVKSFFEQSKPVIAEYNFFSSPTESLIRFNTEQLVDIYCIGWRGKFFKDLSSEDIARHLDDNWLDIYKEYYGKEWDHKGSGLVMLNDKQKRIIVLPSKTYMTDENPVIRTNEEHSLFYQVPQEVAFNGWFSAVYQGKNEVISTLDLNLNQEGTDLLKRNGLDTVFPVTIRSKNNFFYFAGNYSEYNVMLGISKYRVFSDAMHVVCKNMTKNPNQFFHTYYFPFMSTLLEIYHDHQ